MFRSTFARFLAIVLAGASLAFAQDPPPLEPPALEPDHPRATQAQTSPPSASRAAAANTSASAGQPASTGSQVGPMLVIPGVTAPGQRRSNSERTKIPQPAARGAHVLNSPNAPPPAAIPSNS